MLCRRNTRHFSEKASKPALAMENNHYYFLKLGQAGPRLAIPRGLRGQVAPLACHFTGNAARDPPYLLRLQGNSHRRATTRAIAAVRNLPPVSPRIQTTHQTN